MSEFRADIHCHSNCSDGSDSPLALLQKAKEAHLQGLSITDHDTIDAYTPSFFTEADRLGIEILTGIELSSELDDQTVHILGYGFDLDSSSLRAFLKEMQFRRHERNEKLIANLNRHGIRVSREELRAGNIVGRPHLAELMVRKGYVATIQEAFDRFLKEGALCYVGGFKFTPTDVVNEIHLAKGKAVLAHPHFLKKGAFLRKLLSLPLDGIECYYAHLPLEMEKPWIDMAQERGWIATGGSDYHGSIKPHICLGASWVGESVFKQLRDLL